MAAAIKINDRPRETAEKPMIFSDLCALCVPLWLILLAAPKNTMAHKFRITIRP
jgi:hypothetical protein